MKIQQRHENSEWINSAIMLRTRLLTRRKNKDSEAAWSLMYLRINQLQSCVAWAKKMWRRGWRETVARWTAAYNILLDVVGSSSGVVFYIKRCGKPWLLGGRAWKWSNTHFKIITLANMLRRVTQGVKNGREDTSQETYNCSVERGEWWWNVFKK